jgi:hypothetical protein
VLTETGSNFDGDCFESDASPDGVRAVDPPHRRPATHVPEHAPREPTPRQEPPPELVDKRPLPLAYEPPDETLTLTAPLLDTLPLAAPDTTPSWISTPKVELGSQAPRRVVICTAQLPSKREAACAVFLVAVAAIATAATIAALESKIVLIAATFDDE